MDKDGKTAEIVTITMNLNGGDVVRIRRPISGGLPAVQDLQAVGDRVYYAIAEMEDIDKDLFHATNWLASSRRDGSDWRMSKVMEYPPSQGFGYKPFYIVGGKTYYTAIQRYSTKDFRALLGVDGANIISKGSAFGIGLSDGSEVSAFVNGGEDYLCSGEGPIDTAGALATGALGDDTLHQVAGVYDGHWLKLYVDGKLRSTTTYATSPAHNEFPLLLGDGFVGILRDVRIFNGPLKDNDVERLFRHERR